MAGSQVPFPYITGLSDRQKFEIERNYLHIQQEITTASASVYDAIVDPLLTVSLPSSHLYVNFTDLLAGESSTPAHLSVFNIGVRPGTINEPGAINFTGWGSINIAAIGAPVTEGVTVSSAPIWNMPLVTGAQINMTGMRVPSASGTPYTTGFFGTAGSALIMLTNCWIGSGIHLTGGSLYATNSFIGSSLSSGIGGGTSDLVVLHDCTAVGGVNVGGISTFHMLGGYLNGSLTTTGNIAGGFYVECAIQGTVQLNHVEGGVVNNLGSPNGGFFSIGAAVTGMCAVSGAWTQVWLRGSGIRADVTLSVIGANPGLQLVGVTDSLITVDYRPTATGAQAYTIDAASARNVIIAGGTHNAFFTVASTNAGSTCLVIDELFSSSGGTTTDSVRKDMVPGELFAPQSGVNTLPATTAGVAGTAVGGSLAGTLVNPSFAGRDSSVDQINRDLLPAALMDAAGISGALATYPQPVGGVTVGDADYTATPFDRHIQYQTALTALRSVTLAFPNTVPQGTQVTIVDVGAITGGFGIKILTPTFSAIDGTTTTRTINQKRGWITLESNGNTKWTIVGFSDVQEVDMNQAFLLMGG